MENEFVKIDLHIHTPASSDYKGERNDDEYLRLLRQAKSHDLRIISFTDHNSIEGYRNLLKLKDKLISEKQSMSSITDSEQVKSRLRILENDLKNFDDILILPGIEFEVNNAIHLLVIFNNTVPIDQISKFLIDGGYNSDNFGLHKTSNPSKWDILTLFEESKKYDCIIIDAHTDSDKGIYNTTRPGGARANYFRSPQLLALCYKSEIQKEKLQNILTTSKEYYRTTPLAFLKFSDSHVSDTVGLPSTWVKLEKISFESLKTAFSNASELVSTEEPSVVRILDEIINSSNSFGIPDLSKESQELFTKYICALSNCEGGYILLGVTPSKGKVGIPLKEVTNPKSITDTMSKMLDCFERVEPTIHSPLNMYPLQNDKVIISFHIPKASNLVNLKEDGLVYSIKGHSVSVLSATEIECIVEDRVLKEFESKIDRCLKSVETECHLIKNLFSSLPIIRFFDNNSKETRLKIFIENSVRLTPQNINKLQKKPHNGTSRGTLFYFREPQPPRLSHAYLRYTLPLFTIHNINSPSVPKETIYIVPGGGIYYSKKDYPFFSERYPQIIKLHRRSISSKYGMRFTTCFLKSSFLLWYMKNKYDNINLFAPDVLESIRLPVLNIDNPHIVELIDSINEDFDIIANLETTFLIECNKFKEDKQLPYIQEHNRKVDESFHQIDHSIYKLIGLSTDEIATIENNLRLNNIYLPQKEPLT